MSHQPFPTSEAAQLHQRDSQLMAAVVEGLHEDAELSDMGAIAASEEEVRTYWKNGDLTTSEAIKQMAVLKEQSRQSQE